MATADDAQSTASSRSCSTCGDYDDAVLGRMSRLSLNKDDFDGFVTPAGGSTPTKTQDAFTPTRRPLSLYASATPTKPQHGHTTSARPLSLYVPSRTPSKSPLKAAIKSMQKAASSIAKTALPGYATSKAYKDFQRTVAKGN
ncbi:hypothetical protein AAVH_14862 [Aphelenchoides avenae]|nr:hypothetical protein AAVH_14862 [Aphelenchus avenae]